ncbi:MAG: ATP-dependent zinc protease [Cyanobacteriota bacterium]|nr:ATP-dependent zinc protease [Cyanobacteriota bacterium]
MTQKLPFIGWREHVALPELSVDRIKVKIDTGARSSALHAFDIQEFDRDGKPWVRFNVHPLQRDDTQIIETVAPIFDRREVRNSGGTPQLRPFIRTLVQLGDRQWSIELTLTDRSLMGFRMLLGREAVRQRFLVDPGRSFLWSSTDDRPVESKNEDELL